MLDVPVELSGMSREWDWSTLPDVVWVDVMTRLSLTDRSRVALVCRRLNDLFNHPSVWHSVHVYLVGTLPSRRHVRPSARVVAPDRYVAMIRRFGAYFQDVSLTVRGEVCELEQPCRDVLRQLACCRLERLTVKVGEGTVQRQAPSLAASDALLALVKQATHKLRSLNVRSWPVSTDCNIIVALRDNDKLRRLDRLSLFCRDPSEESWVPLTTSVPAPDSVLGLVGQLSSLTSLSVHSTLLTTRLIDVLCQAQRAQLITLGVMVVHARGSVAGYDAKFPRIHDSTWKKLCDCHASVGVELTLCNSIPSYELMSLLSAELPLRSVAFMKYSSYKPDVLTCVAANYHRSLAKFADYGEADGEGGGREVELVSLVGRCTSLRSLVYHGPLTASTVLELAACRASSWKRFEVNVRWTVEHDHGDDVLCVEPTTGAYLITAHLPGSMFYHDDATDQQLSVAYQSVCQQVSDCLGYKWQPLSS